MKDIPAAIQMARLRLILDQPFFGSLVMGLKTKERKDIPTFATDGEGLYYNEQFADQLNNREMLTVLCHEILHCANGTQFRRGNRDPWKWNIATDFAINQIILDCNQHAVSEKEVEPFAFTGALKGACIPGLEWGPMSAKDTSAFKILSSEEIYNLLPANMPKPPPSMGEVMDAKSDPHADVGQKAEEWKVKVIQAATAAKQHGSMPGSIKRMIDELVNPRVPWRDQLRHFFNMRARDDYSWKRPSHRFIYRGLYLPTLDSIRMGPIVVAIDTSGSISKEILQVFQSEMQAIMDECLPAKMTVIYCDADVNKVVEYLPGDQLHLEVHGGGGTDFEPVFEYVQEHNIEAVCLVYLTDMYGSFPDTPPDYPTMWASITKNAEAPFGEVVYVDM